MSSRSGLARAIRIVNVVVCVAAIAYFVSFLEYPTLDIPWTSKAQELLTQALFIAPQLVFLLVLLILEATDGGSSRRHGLILSLIVLFCALGHFWSTRMSAAIQL